MGVKINVNWGELMVLLANARRQYRRAFWGSQNFFNIGMPFAPPELQQDWQLYVTDQINSKMKESRKYFELSENVFASVVTHGIANRIWYDPYKWCPDYAPIEDVRIPTDTTLDYENLEWLAVRKPYTPGELVKKAIYKGSKWDQKTIVAMLKNKRNQNWDYAANNYDWESQPEKLAELVKQDGGYFMGDAMPTIPLWHFFFLDESSDNPEEHGWYMKIVPAEGAQDLKPNKFLWESKSIVAKKLDHLLSSQFGDLSGKAPLMYHSVRSLGFVLLEPTFYTNLTRCRLLQHLHDNFNVWLRSNDPVDKARAQVMEFSNYGVVKPGVTVVPDSERHQVDGNLIEAAMSQLKQLMQEASASYTSNTDTGTKKEQTAFETSVKVEQVNAMLGGLLIKSFMYETYQYREICRRFCLPNSKDPDVQDVQQNCLDYGIGMQHLNSKRWKIEAVTPLGMGNPVLARSAAKELMELRPALDPTAQQEALHEVVLTITNDPLKAARWVPLGKNRGITDAQRDAQAMFGTLMQGVPVPPREGLSAIDQIESMIPLLAGKITIITRRDNKATPDEGAGLQVVSEYIAKLVTQVSQDPAEKQRVKQYGDTLGKLNNEIKALVQRGAADKQQQNGDPETGAKIRAKLLEAKVKSKVTMSKAQQKAKLDSERFVREQRREDAKAFAQIQREGAMNNAKLKSTRE